MKKYLTKFERSAAVVNVKPTHCDVKACATRYPGKGQPKERGYADVIFTLQDGTVIARCSEHYMRDVARFGKSADHDIAGNDWLLTPDNVSAYHARKAAAAKDREASHEN